MPPPERYSLTEQAALDLETIYEVGVRMFGRTQAARYHESLRRTFESLGVFPELARERLELDPPVRVHAHGSHLIVYVVAEERVVIVRVRHGHEDWADHD